MRLPAMSVWERRSRALVAEHGLYDLRAPVQRVAGFDTIMPLFKLEHDYIPSVQRIIDAVELTFAD